VSVRARSQCGLSIGSVKVIRHKKYEFSAGELWKPGAEERNVIQGAGWGENRSLAEEKSNGTSLTRKRRQGCAVDSHASRKKPNVIYFLVDNLGMGELSSYIGGPLRGAATTRTNPVKPVTTDSSRFAEADVVLGLSPRTWGAHSTTR
jgi:hypothetical protein